MAQFEAIFSYSEINLAKQEKVPVEWEVLNVVAGFSKKNGNAESGAYTSLPDVSGNLVRAC
jgi:hypothetical protein